MDEYLLVNGGHPLKGELMVSGSKNGGLYTIAAALLTPDPVVIHNIPEIADVSEMAAVCRSLGSHVEIDGNTLQIHTPSILSNNTTISLNGSAGRFILTFIIFKYGYYIKICNS